MVTSSAVVGSSAISSFGLQAMAMAIITRWHWPPDIWCGKEPRRSSGSAMPTSVSSSMARARRCARSMPMWKRSTSSIWKPTVKHGLRLAIGSWKIIAMSLPTILRRSDGLSVKQIAAVEGHAVGRHRGRQAAGPSPPASRPTCRNRTRRRSPAPRAARPTGRSPCTAMNGPAAVSKETTRFLISSKGMLRTSSAWGRARRAGRRRSG